MDPVASYIASKQTEIEQLKREFASLKSLYFQLKPDGKPSVQVNIDDVKRTEDLDLTTEAGKTARLLEYISQDSFNTLKELFISYATLQSYMQAEKLELAQFHKLIQDCGMLEEGITRVQADLLFCKKNSSKWISFWRFVEIVAEFARVHYSAESGVGRLKDYLSEVVFLRAPRRITTMDLPSLESQISRHDVSLVLNMHTDQLRALYQLYRNKDSKQGKGLLIGKFLTLLTDFHMVPELLTKPEAVRLFRAADSKQFAASSVDFDSFKRALGLTGLFSFSRIEAGPRRRSAPQECVSALFDWLSLSSDQLRIMQFEGGRK